MRKVREFLHQVGRKLRERALLHEEDELLSDLSFGLRAKARARARARALALEVARPSGMKLRPVPLSPSRQARALDQQALPHAGATSAGETFALSFRGTFPLSSRFDERARTPPPRAQMPFFAAAEEGFVSEVGMRMRSCYYSVGEEVGRISRAARASASAARPPEYVRLRIFVYARASCLASRAALAGCAGRARG